MFLSSQATDADTGINADIRYQIINEQAPRFAIDPVTGRVRVVASLARDSGRVFGFDVKATDKRGADDGKSAIANVFVSSFVNLFRNKKANGIKELKKYPNRTS